jgi:hypothetical protein
MRVIKALPGQTWVDIVFQELGDEERIFELCDLFNAGITDDIDLAMLMTMPDFDSRKKRIVQILRELKPSSEFYGVQDPEPGGIDFWAVEINFIVS